MIRSPAELTPHELSFLGVGIRRVTPRQHHVTFLYESEPGMVRLSHLASHRKFRGADPWDATYFWCTAAGIDEFNRKMLAAWLRALALRPQSVDYGLSFKGCEFVRDEAGGYAFVSRTPGKGLTCATYIMLILETVGLPLLEQDTWRARPDDIQWQQDILDALRQHGIMTSEEFELAANDVGCVRYRPIEVAAAADCSQWTVHFDAAVALAQAILRDIVELRFEDMSMQ